MKKFIASALIGLSAVLGLTACEGESSGTYQDDGVNGVIFVPVQGNPVGIPIFY
ncbi:hypothetical protein KIV63_gp50 [Mycobacterium phage SWU2]|uniref:Lipoprotein n=1 Tax=Mycobacterium phage SWU2 TaxID=2077150 RepID=A0A2K9VI19_9CAUD|nr:hypothetical protein KIV63_gp50 [Mycobacterium phage SWU2]AUV61994.1 hypothetical protein JX_gp35 [Mycobacterium phage SWU2]